LGTDIAAGIGNANGRVVSYALTNVRASANNFFLVNIHLNT
jgi:hypothetical protein